MGYEMQDGTYAATSPISLNPLEGQLTVDGYSQVLEMGDDSVVRLFLDVTAVSTSDTLDVNLETSHDGTTWYVAGSFTQATAPASERKCFAVDRFIRAHFNVTGSDVAIDCTLTGESC